MPLFFHMQRGTPGSRSFFSTGPEIPRTPVEVSWVREQAGSTPRALDRDFIVPMEGGAGAGAGAAGGSQSARASSSATSATPGKGKMYNRRTWTKEENEQLQQGMASLRGPDGEIGKNVRRPIVVDSLHKWYSSRGVHSYYHTPSAQTEAGSCDFALPLFSRVPQVESSQTAHFPLRST